MEERIQETQGCANLIQEEMANDIWKVAKKVLGELTGFGFKVRSLGGGMRMCKRILNIKKECFKAL